MKCFFLSQVDRILSIDRDKLSAACRQLKIVPLDNDDMEFLLEYHSVIRPIAHALKILEGNVEFGAYVPILIGLRLKLGEMSDMQEHFHCGPLLKAVSDGFENRFGKLLDIYAVDSKWIPLYLAMLTNPKYKMNFLGKKTIPAHVSEKMRCILYNAGKNILEMEKTTANENDHAASENDGSESTPRPTQISSGATNRYFLSFVTHFTNYVT